MYVLVYFCCWSKALISPPLVCKYSPQFICFYILMCICSFILSNNLFYINTPPHPIKTCETAKHNTNKYPTCSVERWKMEVKFTLMWPREENQCGIYNMGTRFEGKYLFLWLSNFQKIRTLRVGCRSTLEEGKNYRLLLWLYITNICKWWNTTVGWWQVKQGPRQSAI